MIETEIINSILNSKPDLPSVEVLEKIIFEWNDEKLSSWDGGHDLNESTREKVVEHLQDKIEAEDPELLDILRFLVKQEIENCKRGEYLTTTLRFLYDSLAKLKHMEDLPLLLSANHSSFDAHCGLFKDRLFYNGYTQVMDYLKNNDEIGPEIIEGIEFYGEYFGYDRKD